MREKKRSVHVARISRTVKGKTYTSYLLRRSYREGDKVKHETIGNLSDLPLDAIEYIRRRLSGEGPMALDDKFEIKRSLPHGHVAAVLGMLRKIGLDQMIGSKPSRERDLVVSMIVSRIIHPGSKLATLVGLTQETAQSTLAEELRLGTIETKEFYASLDWLVSRQSRIESKLAKKHLADGTLVLYDVSSSYYTGRRSQLVDYGYSRDHKKGLPQIVYGLLCNRDGCPVAIEVFAGNTSDPTTFSQQVAKVRERFSLQRVVFVGDRGMITSQRIDQDLRGVDGLDWITALRSDKIRALTNAGSIQPSLFDEKDLAEVTSVDFPGERLIVCRNPLLAEERARKRNELLAETENKLAQVVKAVSRTKNPLRGAGKIGLRVGPILKKYKMAKHFITTITDDSFTFQRRTEQIENEAKLDGLYVIRTSVKAETLSSDETVRAYKDLSHVERAFRCVKTIDLHIRPIFHSKDERIKSHVFLCMLAYYLEWHMRRELKPVLFDDHDRQAAEATRPSIVAPAPRSKSAKAKDSEKRTEDNYPVQSFQCLLKDLGTLCRNYASARDTEFSIVTAPTPLQRRVFELLGLSVAN
jgi:transposase